MKMHLNLATNDLASGIAFYTTLLNTPPAKVLPDYALFVSQEPGLELALDRAAVVAPATDVHYGICVETAADVDCAIGRLQESGLVASIEREETCCYASQTKVWTTDPDGRRWEIYTVHEETQERDGTDTMCCSTE
jgi:lactoylglutathione lyase